ncbi:MAG: FAD-dependent oxidoreductase, partial [Myxococcales bacterium]|nr:FAD-dependent oxidoreductase [Myxococcales bacterium]
RKALAQLRGLGVQVRLGTRVTAVDPGEVRIGDERIPCSVVLWAAGVRANGLTRTLGVPTDRSGRVIVEPDLSVPGHPHAFVIGDAALARDKDGSPLPGVSPVAMQEARAVARSITRLAAGKPATPFAYFDKGSMATIGRSRAVAQVGRIHLSGLLAWLAWLVVHIWYLIGFRNRLIVMINWAWSYLTYRRGARIITGYAAPDALAMLHGSRPSQAQAAGTLAASPRAAGGGDGAERRSTPGERPPQPARVP